MLAVDRIAAAHERVRQVKAELTSPAAGLPCIQCRYFEIVCTHPAAGKITVSPISGKAKATYPDAEKVRAEDGACGPEGALFDARSVPGQIAIAVLLSRPGLWGLFIAGALLIDWLTG